VVVDGKPGPEWDEVRPPIFSADGRRVAYFAVQDKKWFPVVDGQPGPRFDDFSVRSLRMSPDGAHVAYGVFTGSRMHIFIDGQPGPEFDAIGRNGPAFDGGGALEYIGLDKKEKALYRVRHVPR